MGTPSRSPTPMPVDLGRGADLRQHRRRHADRVEEEVSQASDSRPMSIVREAFVTSVTWTPPLTPPVRCQISHESIVPNRRSPASARPVRSGPPSSRIQASLSADE